MRLERTMSAAMMLKRGEKEERGEEDVDQCFEPN